MKITSKGQVTIPQEFRHRFGLLPDTTVEFIAEKNGLRLVKTANSAGRGRKIAEHLRGRGNGKFTTEQIMKLMRG